MKNFEVRDIRWSKREDFSLPAWYHSTEWLAGYLKLWLGNLESSETSTRVFNVESLQQFENLVKNKIDKRVFVVIPISVRDKNEFLWAVVLNQLGIEIPSWNIPWNPVRVDSSVEASLVLCLDPPIENKITVLIPHWESLGFLELCLYSLRKLQSTETEIKIMICDDNSSLDTWEEVQILASTYHAVAIRILRSDSGKVADVGAVLDAGVKLIDTKYVCMLDADTVVENEDFVNTPLRFLSNHSVVSVGLDTSLGESYHSNQGWPKSINSRHAGFRPPGYQSITNNLYRVMRTEDAIAVSQGIGFSRAVSQRKIRDQIGRVIRRVATSTGNGTLVKKSKDVINSKLLNSRYPNMPPTGDNGVAANGWMDSNFMGCKVNIPIISFGFQTPTEGVAFQNIGNILSHIALSTRALSETRREVNDPGREYIESVEKIIERKGTLEERFTRIIEISKRNIF